MVIFNAGEKIWPVVNFMGRVRAYSRTSPSSLFARDGSLTSITLSNRVAAFQDETAPYGPDFPVLNGLIGGLPSNHPLKSLVFTRDQVHFEGHRVEDLGRLEKVFDDLTVLVKEKFGWTTLIDYVERQPVLLIIGLNPVL